MIQKTSTIKTIQKFNNFINEVKKIINREKEKKEREFIEFIKKVESSIQNKENKKCEEFKNFIKEAKEIIYKERDKQLIDFRKFIENIQEIIQKDKANKERDFKIFIEKVNKIIQEKEDKNRKQFRDFINKVEEYIIKDVENWPNNEKKLFEIYNEKQETNIFEGFDTEGTYRDFLVWLLEPENSHQLSDKFLKSFVSYIAKENINELEFENIEIKKEELGIDFIINGKNFYCAVEMKLWGWAKRIQLRNYKNELEKNLNYKNKKYKFKICLDPKEYIEEDRKKIEETGFKLMNWWELSKILAEIYDEANNDVKSLIRQFIKQMFNFVEEINDFARREDMLKKKRWFEIYKNKKGG